MGNEVNIKTQIIANNSCQFIVDRPVYPRGSYYFASDKSANGSPLVEQLFKIKNVVSVFVSENVVKVTKTGDEDWQPIAEQVSKIIETQLQSGLPAISESVRTNLPLEEKIREKVQRLFDSEINPAVAKHGGIVELVDVVGNDVYLRMGGGCQGCGMAYMTLKQGIEQVLRHYVPEIGKILDVTDHQGGRNPFYKQHF